MALEVDREGKIKEVNMFNSNLEPATMLGTPDEWIQHCKYKPYVRFSVLMNGAGGWLLQLDADVEDTYHHGTTIRIGAPYPMPPWAVENEESFYDFFRQCCHNWEQHETDEWIEIKGERRWNPHR